MVKLTRRTVEAARRPSRERERWTWPGDVEVPGFGVKLYPNGRRKFALRHRTTRTRQLDAGHIRRKESPRSGVEPPRSSSSMAKGRLR